MPMIQLFMGEEGDLMKNLGQNSQREVCAGVILETLGGVVLLSEFGVNDSVPCTAEG